jgi:hypothetical protein
MRCTGDALWKKDFELFIFSVVVIREQFWREIKPFNYYGLRELSYILKTSRNNASISETHITYNIGHIT